MFGQINENVKGGSAAERLFVPSPKPKHFFMLRVSRHDLVWLCVSSAFSSSPTSKRRRQQQQQPAVCGRRLKRSVSVLSLSLPLSLFLVCRRIQASSLLVVRRTEYPCFPWRRPAALNGGGRVVYLNGYWVA